MVLNDILNKDSIKSITNVIDITSVTILKQICTCSFIII